MIALLLLYNVISKRDEGYRKEAPDMLKKISDTLYKHGSYEDTFIADYESDSEITAEDVEVLIASDYHMFPVTGSSYAMNGNHLIITYTVDHCN